MLRTLFAAPILAGALAGSAIAQAPDAGCGLPSEPEGIPAALDAAITGPADKDRARMRVCNLNQRSQRSDLEALVQACEQLGVELEARTGHKAVQHVKIRRVAALR